MSARERILARVREGAPRGTPHPGRFAPAPQPAGWDAFAAVLRAVGGEPHGPVAPGRIADAVKTLLAGWRAAGRVVAEPRALARLGPGPWQAASGDPHDLADVTAAIVPGCLGVAESGAVLVEAGSAACAALPFLCERLVLLLPVTAILPDLHAATERLAARGTLPPRAVWISGPSKTADIEQALVLGAHGPLAAAVVGIAEE